MVWDDEPEPAHWRIRSQHATRQESRSSRVLYLAIMFPISLFMSALAAFILLAVVIVGLVLGTFFFLLFYGLIFVFLPVYATVALVVVWFLHLLKISTGFGPARLAENPRDFIAQKAKGFKEIMRFALTWRWTEDDVEKVDAWFKDPEGPHKPFEYRALPVENDQQMIRVLDLLSGERNCPLRCRVRHVSLKLDEPAFEAISYCWGGQQPSIPVYIDDATGPTQLLATENLVQALQRFRLVDQERTVWADGLCINQAPEALDERIGQVRLMGEIYRKAQRCLIWLGLGPEDAEACLDATKQLVRIESDFNAADVYKDPIFMSAEEKNQHNIPHGQTPHLRGLQLILSSAWLTRVWIVQEASLAREATIYLGDGSMTLGELATAQKFAREIGLLHSESELPVDGMSAIRVNRIFQSDRLPVKGEDTVLALFARFRNFDATQAEDKINGLISLMSERHRSQWPVGHTAEQAFIHAAHRILDTSHTLDLLGIPRNIGTAGQQVPSKLDIPSWVPDWMSRNVPVSLRMLEFAPHGATPFAATQNTTYDVSLGQDGRLLAVDGYRVCSIRGLGKIHLYRPISIDISKNDFIRKRVETILALIDTYFDWKRTAQLNSTQTTYPHSSPPTTTREALMKTIAAYEPIATTVPLDRLTTSFEAFDVMITRMRRLRFLLQLIPLVHAIHTHRLGVIILAPYIPLLFMLYSIMAQDPEAQDFCNNLVPAMGRRMARTDDGHFALVPGNAAVGDEITLLKGAKMPIVMRKRTEDENWEHMGEAYVEGLMTGSGWDESRCERRWLA